MIIIKNVIHRGILYEKIPLLFTIIPKLLHNC